MTSINRFPDSKCYTCKGDDWYWRNGEWVCGSCHPPAPDVALRFRVIKGNYKMFNLLETLLAMPQGDRRDKMQTTFDSALVRLKELRDQMIAAGSTDCLYIDGGKKWQKCLFDPDFRCTICPNDYWWEKELAAYDLKMHPGAKR